MRRKSRVSLSLSDDLISEIEERRGLVSRSTFVEYLIRRGLKTMEPKAIRRTRRAPTPMSGS